MPDVVQLVLNAWGLVLTVVSGCLLLVAALNIGYFQSIRRRPKRESGPMVSVLIPARNEADTIGECLDSLLHQSYDNYEIIVLDDNSTDDTPSILRDYERGHDRIRIIEGRDRPDGWKGKTFAVQQLAEAARGEYLYLADADTKHGPHAVSWAVSRLEERELDAFSAMARQITATFVDRLLVPMVYLPLIFVPVQLFNARRLRSLSFGVGQFFMFRTSAFLQFGGMEPVREEITEDVALSRELKKRGYRYEYFYSRGHVSCRMYGGFRASVEGFNKNIYDIVSSAPLLAACVAPVVLMLFTLPALALAANAIAAVLGAGVAINLLLLTDVAAFLVSWGIHLVYYRQPVWLVFLAPAFFAFLVGLVYRALNRYQRGKKPVWKSRKVDSAGP
jgi:chlorobactene glucosyltransferase